MRGVSLLVRERFRVRSGSALGMDGRASCSVGRSVGPGGAVDGRIVLLLDIEEALPLRVGFAMFAEFARGVREDGVRDSCGAVGVRGAMTSGVGRVKREAGMSTRRLKSKLSAFHARAEVEAYTVSAAAGPAGFAA